MADRYNGGDPVGLAAETEGFGDEGSFTLEVVVKVGGGDNSREVN